MQKKLKRSDLKKIENSDWQILSDYVKAMRPFAMALDVLQGQNLASLGYVLSALTVIKSKMSNLSFCTIHGTRFRMALNNCLISRFQKILEFDKDNKDLILAAATHPEFKLSWIENESDRNFVRNLLISECSQITEESPMIDEENVEDRPVENTFFSCLKRISLENRRHSSDSASASIESIQYLEENLGNISCFSGNKFSTIKKLFIKFNTTLSSSAPVERLFSQALMIFSPRRNRMNDNTFEMNIFLKHNMELLLANRSN